ncbi:MAG TPA: flagellar hook-basal body complex protein FliE [Bryobacteraceae bacterium]|nr:flagellar hook-basal body complex protein FliE [Bryobacteraceae bacterium]
MSLPITPIHAVPHLPAVASAAAPREPGGAFQAMFNTALGTVENLRADAEVKVGKFLSGEGEELHTVVMATQQAELSMELFQQVRNKVVQAYQEVMRMQM